MRGLILPRARGAPNDDSEGFLPGRSLAGAVVPLAETPVRRGQLLTLVAAYVDPDTGAILKQLPAQDIQFSLSETSALRGFAMNMGSDAGPDYSFENGTSQQSSPLEPQTGLAKARLMSWDYGGYTQVTARTSGGLEVSVTLPLPIDPGNRLPKNGWKLPSGATVSTANLIEGDDIEDQPAVSGPPGLGNFGDGLTVFEEYRGFMARGGHRRTNPLARDLFISSNMPDGLGFAHPNLPLVVHRIFGLNDLSPAEYNSERVINFNYQNSQPNASDIPRDGDQRALRIVRQPGGGGDYGLTFPIGPGYAETPNETRVIEIYTTEHEALRGSILPGLSYNNEQVRNEYQRTVAHEVGHAIHICHRPYDIYCGDGAVLGPVPSVMDIPPAGTPVDHPLSGYNAADRAQIRLHIRF